MASDAAVTFTECDTLLEHPDPPPLRQGDVFEWLEQKNDVWQRWGVIVTANCDFANEKHGGIISYVPVLSLKDYARLFLLPSALRKAMRRHREEVVAHVRKLQSAHATSFPVPLSEAAIIDWVEGCEPNEVLEQLGVPAGKERDKALTTVSKYRIGSAALVDGQFDRLLNAVLSLREGKPEKLREELSQQVKNLPGDAFFLGSIGADERGGCVAYLRILRELKVGQVAIRQSDFRDAQVVARRLSRVRAPYIYRLTQQLAEVFVSIGLPREYETNRESLAAGAFSVNGNTTA
jgi:hypothetical protein